MPDSTAPQRTLESLTSSFHTVCLIFANDSFGWIAVPHGCPRQWRGCAVSGYLLGASAAPPWRIGRHGVRRLLLSCARAPVVARAFTDGSAIPNSGSSAPSLIEYG